MATRRNQLLTLIRQAAVGSVPITTPPELQVEWNAVVAKYLAQTEAKRRLWLTQVADAQKADYAVQLATMPPALLGQLAAAIDANSATEVV